MNKDDIKKAITNAVLDQMPDRTPPTFKQELIMFAVQEKSGISIVQDKGAAFMVMGPAMQGAEGTFIGKDVNPRFPNDVIVINSNADQAYWYNVLFHELAHATGTAARLNRVGIALREKTAAIYCYEELIAESTARSIMRHLGLETPETVEKSHKYINDYAMRLTMSTGLPVDIAKLALEVEAAEKMVMSWLDGIDFKAA